MANYKVVDTEQLDSDLTIVADAIREKGGTTEKLSFPSGMENAIRAIESGTDTSDATATAEDIAVGKTAYTADGLVEGTAERSLKKFLDYSRSTYMLFYDRELYNFDQSIFQYDDTTNVTNMSYMFNKCYVYAIPLFNTSNVTNMKYMFSECFPITTIPLFDTGKVTNMNSMFNGCSKLTTIPLLNTSNVTDMGYMFSNCTALTEVPPFDTGNVADMTYIFSSCSKLTTIPLLNTSNVTNMSRAFYGCTALTEVPPFDMRNVTRTTYMFSGCTALTECWIRNIKTSLQVGSGTTYGHLLTIESLLHLIGELVDVDASRTLTIGTANLEKLAGVYVKLIDITDEMRVEDSLIDSKLPFEVCESTDECAMTINNYVAEKMWQIK